MAKEGDPEPLSVRAPGGDVAFKTKNAPDRFENLAPEQNALQRA